MVLAFGYYVLFNSDLFSSDKSEPDTVHVIQTIRADFTPLPPTNAAITPNEEPNNQSFLDLLADLNATRQAANTSALTLNSKLSAAAAVQAAYSASIGHLSHEGAAGDRVQNRVEAQGYVWRGVGENLLSRWDVNGHLVFKQWQASYEHKQNMMNPKFTEVGLAYMINPNGEVYYAMVLGRPR